MRWLNLAYALLHGQPSAGGQHLHLAEDPFLREEQKA